MTLSERGISVSVAQAAYEHPIHFCEKEIAMKKLLAVVTLSLWHSAVFAYLFADEMPGKLSPTVDEISFQSLRAESSTLYTNPFALTSEGAYMVAPECITLINPANGAAQEYCYWEDD